MNQQSCRLYRQEYPEVGDLVIGEVTQVDLETGARADLLEYPGLTGLAILKELSRRRIKSLRQVIRIGQQEVFEVTRVDRDKDYIDISKKIVTAEEREKTLKRYQEAKRVFGILSQTCYEYNQVKNEDQSRQSEPDLTPNDIYEEFLWQLPEERDPMDYFKELIYLDPNPDPETGLTPGMDPPIPRKFALLEKYVRKAVNRTQYRMTQKVEVVCYAPDGVTQIKEGMSKAQTETNQKYSDGPQVEIFIDTPPIYVIQCLTENQKAGLQILQECQSRIQTIFTSSVGHCQIKEKPQVAEC